MAVDLDGRTHPDPAWLRHVDGDIGEPSSAEARTPIPTIGVDEILAPLPDRQWLCDRLRIAGGGRPTLIVGPPGGGKTIDVQTLVVALASGRRWCGVHDVVQSRVLHLDGEVGHWLTCRRYQRIVTAAGVTRDDIVDRLRVAIYPPLRLDDPTAEATLAATCAGYGVVVLDSLTALAGAAEEHTTEMGRLMLMLARVSGATGAAIVVLHHTRRDGETRGSTSIYAGAECIWRMVDVDGGRATLHHDRSPEGDPQPDLTLAIRDVAIGDDARGGLMVDVIEPESTPERPAADHAALMRVIVDHLRERGPVHGGGDVLAAQLGRRAAAVRAALRELIATSIVTETGATRARVLHLRGAT